MESKKKEAPPVIHNAIAGTIAGGFATTVLHPLDLVKTRLQVQDGLKDSTKTLPQYKGTIHAFLTIIKSEGPLGVYQGLTPNLIGASAAWGLYFWIYNFFKKRLQTSSMNKNPGGDLSAGLHLLAASEAGVVTAILTNPIWVVKTRMQLQMRKGEGNYLGVPDALKTIWREEGIKGLYKGLVPGLFGVSHGALQFMAYEEIKKSLIKYYGDPNRLGSVDFFFMGATSKVFAAVTTYPYQVIRSRLQERPKGNVVKYTGAMDVIKKTYKNEGWKGFYKGLVPNILRVTPAASITFVVYENIMKVLERF